MVERGRKRSAAPAGIAARRAPRDAAERARTIACRAAGPARPRRQRRRRRRSTGLPCPSVSLDLLEQPGSTSRRSRPTPQRPSAVRPPLSRTGPRSSARSPRRGRLRRTSRSARPRCRAAARARPGCACARRCPGSGEMKCSGRPVGAAQDERDGEQDPDHRAVAPEVALLRHDTSGSRRSRIASTCARSDVQVVGMRELLVARSDQLVGGPAEHRAEGVVDPQERAVRVEQRHADGRGRRRRRSSAAPRGRARRARARARCRASPRPPPGGCAGRSRRRPPGPRSRAGGSAAPGRARSWRRDAA